MAKACGVSIKTIGRWRQKGLIRAYAINDRTQFFSKTPEQIPEEARSKCFEQGGLTCVHVPIGIGVGPIPNVSFKTLPPEC
jgi:hypothetical protein